MKHAFIFFTLSLLSLEVRALPRNDSVKVVKGQVSDYYISTAKPATTEGYVTDENGAPLHGATVMPLASPVHCNSRADGYFSLAVGKHDSVLMIYYPGKEIERFNFRRSAGKPRIRLSPLRESAALIAPAVPVARATRWFDPKNDNPDTYCNPVNMGYDFRCYLNDVVRNGSFRSTADPLIVLYKDEYYLFSTNQAGFFLSRDLSRWEFVYASFQRFPTDDDLCAPAAFVRGDTLFYTGSTYAGMPVWYSTDPKSGRFKRYVEKTVLPSWDPGFLEDDDGRLYMYYGSSNEYPLKGVELSRHGFYPVGRIEELMSLHPARHGWERFGMNNDDSLTLAPFTEGAWMTKHRGKYYLQYGAPGTEFKVYADGVYVSDKPLGPFVYQQHNPMSYKPGGFVLGAGHGGTFADRFGNYWHVATCMLSLKYKFERRIALYPAGFDDDGVMYCNTAFGDYPCRTPRGKADHTKSRFTGWMLLSYGKRMTASSSDGEHLPQNASDENIRTYWSAASDKRGEWLQMDLGATKEVRAIQINYYDHKATQYNKAMDIYHQYRVLHSLDGEAWELLIDKSDNDTDVPHDYVQLREPVSTRYLKLENIHAAAGHFALSDLRVFGSAGGSPPPKVSSFKVNRSTSDPRNALITWDKAGDAYGYNIYYGVHPDKLYNCITVNGATSYDFRGLDVDTQYYFAIEALNENYEL
ncbi:MAG: family 43 glycosylhydrolase [Prevotellaceae bacterium]|jgi:hypothetical protein|nr:family 43 glycosylhydrolase [Prevotellaceae bacterium]